LECVVVDDCSTDASVANICNILDEISDPRFRFIKRDENGGQMAAMFTGFDLGNGPFVAFLDADDIWFPTFLEKHVSCHMNSEINASLSASNLATIDADGVLLAGTCPAFSQSHPTRNQNAYNEIALPPLRHEGPLVPSVDQRTVYVRNRYQDWIWAPTSGLMFRRAVLDAIRPRNVADFPICADLYLARFAHLVGGSILTNEVHGYYRIHGSNSYSKKAIYGDNTKFDSGPPSVGAATRMTMLHKLCEDKLLRSILPDAHRAETALRLAKRGRELRQVFKSGISMKQIDPKLRRKLKRRAVVRSVTDIFKRH